ncbi:MAG: aspartate aminotransferase family protein, partial [Vicinamibacterales bacterium]
ERATTERDRVVDGCFSRGLLVLGAGRNAIRLSPPLVLSKAQAATAVTIIDQALAALSTGG